ncbi:MAG: hypothetical protein IJ859_03280 [Synergistaceae bacterium]|nr:hypothetical protein [Synergistaceae bacterium]
MFDNVAAFEGDSTTIKIFPLPEPVTFTAALADVDFFAAVFFVALVLVVLVLVVEAVFVVFFSFLTLASVAADDFLDAGIVITPV